MTRSRRPRVAPSQPEPELEPWRGPSRSQQRRDAKDVTALGLRLTKLSDRELGLLGLDEELIAAVHECRRLTKNAHSRQLRLVAKLLRARPIEPLREALGLLHGKRSAENAREQHLEAQRRALLTGGDPALERYMQEHPGADRQHLRALVRDAARTPPSPPSQRAFRQLLRALREVASASERDQREPADGEDPTPP